METRGIEQMIGQMRATADAAASKPASADGAESVDFSQVLQGALQQVSQAQTDARAMAEQFSAGDPNVNLQDVMVNLQKASLSFQQMVQVRNRLVTAYQDMMNMQV
ncbi:flagellar hook-basal body complex protein FliE [Niveibacterium sp. 24ML]|uniref:flagellar hook-basal body complex protein FliE n=1 Tax=Niveibacterium sp. 24ML TaxID=2985512 RepID=UPI00226FA9D6|nr:flagellar hook-basal body complex protein FliE [Niveibacterium sp. 24ML]MCX9157931.1 flagellar hook-basal body complex protein FliE [Niveibacterium sp. 24ML]